MHKTHRILGAFSVLFLLAAFAGAQQPAIRWETTLENAQRQAGQANRLVMIYFWAPWCTVCQRMEAEVLSQPSVAGVVAANYVAVKVNADYFPTTAQRYGVSGLPTTVIITPQGQAVDTVRGRMEASAFATPVESGCVQFQTASGRNCCPDSGFRRCASHAGCSSGPERCFAAVQRCCSPIQQRPCLWGRWCSTCHRRRPAGRNAANGCPTNSATTSGDATSGDATGDAPAERRFADGKSNGE